MMNCEPENHVAAIVEAAGGKLVSRIRFQKIAYLLEQLGMEGGFDFTYHHYGPYSRGLDSAVLDAVAFGYVEEEINYRKSDGARYSIFIRKKGPDEDVFKGLSADPGELVHKLAKTNVTVLELAATAHWLAAVERVPDWRSEIQKRKGSKTENGRLDEAMDLLRQLDLPPAKMAV